MNKISMPVLTGLALLLGVLPHAGVAQRTGRLPHASEAPVLDERESLVSVLTGHVLTSAGRPAHGAVVVSSAGGKAVTDADGSFWLDVELPLDAESVQLTATQGSGTTGSTGSVQVLLGPPGDVHATGFLSLVRGASCQPDWLPTFGQVPGVGGAIDSMAVFDDGSGGGPALYAAGNLTTAGGVAVNKIAKWDGARWSPVGSGAPHIRVYAMAVFDDGSGGGPALYTGGLTGGIKKWDGTSWTSVGSGFNGSVYALTVFDDGSGPALYAGGQFNSAGVAGTSAIARWNGSSFSALGTGMDGGVYALTCFDDGSGEALYAGGGFTSAGGTAASRIARWDGTSWTSLGSGVNEVVTDLAAFDDGSGGGPALYAAGNFTVAGGAPARRVARWDGSDWSPLANGTTHGIEALEVFDDGSGGGPALYAAGAFTGAGGVVVNRVAKWNGTSWSSLATGLDNTAIDLVVHDDGSGPALFVGGVMANASGLGVHGIAEWNGTAWSALGEGLTLQVKALAAFESGNGGGPELYASSTALLAHRLARWSENEWANVAGEPNAPVLALAVFDDGNGGGTALHVGGGFTSAGGAPAPYIARWNGSAWSTLGNGMNNAVRALTTFDDGVQPLLYAGGSFTSAGGVAANYVAQWDGSSWSPLGSGLDGSVAALAVCDEGGGPVLYAGGSFSTAGGVPAEGLARWDGTSWSAVGGEQLVLFDVRALAVFDDGSGGGPALHVGGSFGSAGSVDAANVAKWDGASWSALGSGTNQMVEALVVFDEGSGEALYAGGRFTTAGGGAANRIAKWDGATWTPLGSGTNGNVQALAVFDDGASGPALVAGGVFSTAFDSGDSFVARWQGCIDTAAPTLHAPASVVKGEALGSPPGENVTFTVTASDFFDPAPLVVCVPPSGSFFPRGTTLVTCTATDAVGNQSSCEFPVTVELKVRKTGF